MVRYELNKGPIPVTAAADLLANLFVGYDGNPCAAGAKAMGVPAFDIPSGENGSIYTAGDIVPVIAGGQIAVGAAVAAGSGSKAVAAAALTVASGATPVTSSAANGAILAGAVAPVAINGYALDAASADGDVIRVQLV
jgi:hypothetical protein